MYAGRRLSLLASWVSGVTGWKVSSRWSRVEAESDFTLASIYWLSNIIVKNMEQRNNTTRPQHYIHSPLHYTQQSHAFQHILLSCNHIQSYKESKSTVTSWSLTAPASLPYYSLPLEVSAFRFCQDPSWQLVHPYRPPSCWGFRSVRWWLWVPNPWCGWSQPFLPASSSTQWYLRNCARGSPSPSLTAPCTSPPLIFEPVVVAPQIHHWLAPSSAWGCWVRVQRTHWYQCGDVRGCHGRYWLRRKTLQWAYVLARLCGRTPWSWWPRTYPRGSSGDVPAHRIRHRTGGRRRRTARTPRWDRPYEPPSGSCTGGSSSRAPPLP